MSDTNFLEKNIKMNPETAIDLPTSTTPAAIQIEEEQQNPEQQQQNRLVDEQGRFYEIVGDPDNHRGKFIKPILGYGSAPCGVHHWYSCIFPVGAPFHFVFLGFFVTGIVVCFCLFAVPSGEVWSIVIAVVLLLVALYAMWAGTSTDPGIVLPARHGDRFYPEGEKNVFISEEIGRVDLKPCHVCKITRPYRVSHCGVSGHCLHEADHMCGVLGISVAKRTMRYFVGSIFGLVFLALFCALRSLVGIVKGDNDHGAIGIIAGWIFVLLGACMLCCLAPFGGMHVYNGCLGRNERDAVRTRKDEEHGHRAYGKHGKYECSFSNFYEAFCGGNGESVLLKLSQEDLQML
jgi:hypothetical protein